MENNDIKLQEFVVKRIDELCQERNMSKYKLCQMTGIAQSSLSTMGRGKTLPSITTLAKLCEGLDISVFDFFNRDDEAAPVVTADEKLILKYWNQISNRQKDMVLSFVKGIIAESELKETIKK